MWVVVPTGRRCGLGKRETAAQSIAPDQGTGDVDLRLRASGVAEHVRIPALDGLRGLAVLLVVAFHAQADRASGLARFASAGLRAGWVGVDLFFVLSGFLITGILLDAKGKGGYFRTFYTRRGLRILPLYYVTLLTAFGTGRLVALPVSFESMRGHEVFYWTHTFNFYVAAALPPVEAFSHFWSLCIEEQFYLLWPAVVLLLGARALAVLCACLYCASVGIRYWLTARGWDAVAVYAFTPSHVDGLTAGAMLAALRRLLCRDRFDGVCRAATMGGAVMVIVIAVLAREFHPHHRSVLVGGIGAVSLLFFGLVGLATSAGGCVARLGSNVVLRWFGRYSYAIYVFHWPVVMAMSPRYPASGSWWFREAAIFGAVLLASSLAALVSWHALEKHANRLKGTVGRDVSARGRGEVRHGSAAADAARKGVQKLLGVPGDAVGGS